jgi:hypothetical protein
MVAEYIQCFDKTRCMLAEYIQIRCKEQMAISYGNTIKFNTDGAFVPSHECWCMGYSRKEQSEEVVAAKTGRVEQYMMHFQQNCEQWRRRT